MRIWLASAALTFVACVTLGCAEGAADGPGAGGPVVIQPPTPIVGQTAIPPGGAAGMAAPMAAGSGPAGMAGGAAGMELPMMPPPMTGTAGMTTVGQPGGSGAMAGTGGAPMMPMAGRGGTTAPMPMAGSTAPMPMAGTTAQPMVPAGMEVPATAHCMSVASWDPAWVAFEDEVLKLVNENRAKGWNCDTKGMFTAAGALASNPALRCAARLHSKDMNDRMFFDHTNPDRVGPGPRVNAAGYTGSWGENIAVGQRTPAQVVSGWMDSDGHCANIMNPRYKQIGVGFFKGTGSLMSMYWTQNFGS